MGPWIFSKHQGLLVDRPSAKIHFGKLPPPKKNIVWETWKTSFFEEMATFVYAFLLFFLGPMGPGTTWDHMGPHGTLPMVLRGCTIWLVIVPLRRCSVLGGWVQRRALLDATHCIRKGLFSSRSCFGNGGLWLSAAIFCFKAAAHGVS